MAIKYFANNRLEGLSTDTKPTTVYAGSHFYETDTKETYVFDGVSTWSKQSVGATVEASEIANASIPFSKIANGTANKTLGFNSSGVISELTSSTGVDPSATVETVPMPTDIWRDWDRPIWIEGGLNPDTSKTPRQRWHYTQPQIAPTFYDDFSTGGLAWTHYGANAYVSQESLNLHNDTASASALDLRQYVGTVGSPLPISTDQWTLRFNFEWTDYSTVTNADGYLYFGLSSKGASYTLSSYQNFVGFIIKGNSSAGTTWNNVFGMSYGTQTPTSAYSNYTSNGGMYNQGDISHIEMVRNGNRIFCRMYADKWFRKIIYEWIIDSANSYFNDDTTLETLDPQNQALRYLKVVGSGSGIKGRVDEVIFWNDYAYGFDNDHNNPLKTLFRGTPNYGDRGRPRWANPESCTIGQIVPVGNNQGSLAYGPFYTTSQTQATISATNKWMNGYDSDDTLTWDYGVDTNDTNGLGALVTTATSQQAISTTTSSGTFGLGFQINSMLHPLVNNGYRHVNEAGIKGATEIDPASRTDYGWSTFTSDYTVLSGTPACNIDSQSGRTNMLGMPLKNLSFWLWKVGTPTGKLVCRVYNNQSNTGNARMGTEFRAVSRNTVDVSTVGTTESTGTKITFDMGGYTPRLYDFFCVEFEANPATRNDGVPFRYRSTGALASGGTVVETCDASNKVLMKMRRLTNDTLQYFCYHYNTSSMTYVNHYQVIYEATFQGRTLKTKQYANPYFDIWVGLKFNGDQDQWINGDNRQYRQGAHWGTMYDQQWSIYGNYGGTAISNETYHYDKWSVFTNSGTSPNLTGRLTFNNFGDTNVTYSYATTHDIINKRREDTLTAAPAYRQFDFKNVAWRSLQIRAMGDIEVWVSDRYQGDPKSAGAGYSYRDSTLNDWRRIGWNVGEYIYINERFRFCRIYLNSTAASGTSGSTTKVSTYLWYIHNHQEKRQLTCGVALKLNTTETTETQFQIQVSNPWLADDDASKWTTVRTINVASITSGTWNRILIPVSNTNKIRIKGSSGNSRVLAIEGIKVLYRSREEIQAGHGHVVLSPTDATIPLLGS